MLQTSILRSKPDKIRFVKRLARIAGIAITVACVGYFISVGVEHATEFPTFHWQSATIIYLAAATILFTVGIVIGGVAWSVVLRATGEPWRLRPAVVTMLLTQIAKYLPGNIGHVVGRVVLARQYGFAMSRIVLSMTFEMGWTVITAAIVAVIVLILEGPRLSVALPDLQAGWLALVLAVALAAPVIGAWVLGRWRPRPLLQLLGDASVSLPGAGTTLIFFSLYCVNFALAGFAFDLLALGPIGVPESQFTLLTGVFAVAFVAGYITPGAPGGLGVREAILVAALGPIYGDGTAVALALVVRVCNVAADGLGFLIGLALRRSLTPK